MSGWWTSMRRSAAWTLVRPPCTSRSGCCATPRLPRGNTERVLPFQILVEPGPSGLAKPSEAQSEQLRALSFDRFVGRLGRLDRAAMTALDDAIRVHLSLRTP